MKCNTKIIRTLITACCFLSVSNLNAQLVTSANKDALARISYNIPINRDVVRKFQYLPEGNAFVCINGNNRFTRSLYGTNTESRLETSDRPVFASYYKSADSSRNIRFVINNGNKSLWLDSAEYCKAGYLAGKRYYELRDKLFSKGKLHITALALAENEGAVWKIETENFPKNFNLVSVISKIKADKLKHLGEMGTNPPDVLEAGNKLGDVKVNFTDKKAYLLLEGAELQQIDNKRGEIIYLKAESCAKKISEQITIRTPDKYINTVAGALSSAADGVWDGKNAWLHGAIGWRMPLTGWRAAYTGDFLGYTDRARKHFDAYAASQVTSVEPTVSHPSQDTTLHLARAEKKWGTQMYSNGYICRSPFNSNQMHHYDMNLVYVDELLWHLNWTGDLNYARKMFPLLNRHLEWEKRNFDPDDDGLYDAYCCIWASDALQYNSGGVTHSSAYNYRANKITARIAELINEDPTPYRDEARKILKAMNDKLWLKETGCWAEYVDFMGYKKTHPSAALWTVYHSIDSEVGDIFQQYQTTRYVDREIPHIPVKADGLNGTYEVLSTTNWLPYAWSINNVAFAEIAHTSLAYWQAGRANEAFRLFKSAILDGMYLGRSPGNVGQISFYDAARGETYRDFGDPVGIYSRALVQGLFGISPDLLNGRVIIRPSLPRDWNFAEFTAPYLEFNFRRKNKTDYYLLKNKFAVKSELILRLPVTHEKIKSVKINGKTASWTILENIEFPLVEITCGNAEQPEIKIEWEGNQLKPSVAKTTGKRDGFVKLLQREMSWWQPTEAETRKQDHSFAKNTLLPDFLKEKSEFIQINIDSVLNASVTDIFKNKYLSPRSPYTTLQTPWQGVGEWCKPLLTYEIDDTGLRRSTRNQTFTTPMRLPFRIPDGKNNIAFTTLWDNYPDSLSVTLSGRAQHAVLLMAGTTNPMQSGFVNGTVTVSYKDGTSETLQLINPDTWCTIEQDYYTDGQAFRINTPRPYRVAFKSGIVSSDIGNALNIDSMEVYGRVIDGGAGVILNIPLDKNKELQSLKLKSLANEVIIGLMAVTLVK